MSDEQWKPVPGYEGLYDVSDLGRVRSWHKGVTAPSIMATPLGKPGYPLVHLREPKKAGRTWSVHSLVMAAFRGPKPAGMQIRHLDGSRTNNQLANLRYGTASENMRDKALHGTDYQRNKTHCPQGHEYTEANTRVDGGRRFCRACHRARGMAKVACEFCGLELTRVGRYSHIQRHHSGRPFGRVYVRQPIDHGTANGYRAHCKRNEPVPPGDPCGCRAAHAAAALARKRARAAKTALSQEAVS